jgi:RNA polymerase sigma-70 factor (ECF subfamily)
LVRRHLDLVVRHAQRYVGERSGAEDVAQEVFLRLFRSRDRFREPNNFSGWLVTITTRIALNELRTRRRKRWVPRSSLEAEDPGQDWRAGGDVEERPEEALLREERIAAVREALARLPDNQREAILLQKFEGWDLVQIGEAMDLSVPAVKSLLHRARRALEGMLGPVLEEEAKRT